MPHSRRRPPSTSLTFPSLPFLLTPSPKKSASSPLLSVPHRPCFLARPDMRHDNGDDGDDNDNDDDDDGLIFTSWSPTQPPASSIRSRHFGPRHREKPKCITTTPGLLGAGETETEADEPVRRRLVDILILTANSFSGVLFSPSACRQLASSRHLHLSCRQIRCSSVSRLCCSSLPAYSPLSPPCAERFTICTTFTTRRSRLSQTAVVALNALTILSLPYGCCVFALSAPARCSPNTSFLGYPDRFPVSAPDHRSLHPVASVLPPTADPHPPPRPPSHLLARNTPDSLDL